MAEESSSPRRPTKKAATPNRSTTSSTTGGGQQPAPTAPTDSGEGLSEDEKRSILDSIALGGSPSGACLKIGVEVTRFFKALTEDEEFRRRWKEINVTLSQNIVARLYHIAMQGNVSALTCWIKNNPPPEWTGENEEAAGSIDEFFDQLSDEQLIELARTMGIDLPPEIEAKISSEGG